MVFSSKKDKDQLRRLGIIMAPSGAGFQQVDEACHVSEAQVFQPVILELQVLLRLLQIQVCPHFFQLFCFFKYMGTATSKHRSPGRARVEL